MGDRTDHLTTATWEAEEAWKGLAWKKQKDLAGEWENVPPSHTPEQVKAALEDVIHEARLLLDAVDEEAARQAQYAPNQEGPDG